MAAKRNRPEPARRRRHALFIGALWIAALLAYSNSFHDGLVFDSQRVILADSRIQADTPDNLHQIWTGDYYNGTGSGALYRPLTTLTYLWNYADLGNGPNPAGYHTLNFAIHALNIALVYLLAFGIFAETGPAVAMAALWLLHPILTEAVTNVVGRADLLAAFGVLAGLACYIRGEAAKGWRFAAWTCGLAAASAIAVFSKESGVVLIAALLAYDLAFGAKYAWRARAVSYAAVLAPAAWFFAQRAQVLAQVSSLLISYGDNPLQGVGFLTSRLTAVKALGEYLWLLFWPARLSPDYSYNQIPLANFTDPKALVALLVWLAVVAAAVWSWRRARPVFFFILFFAVTIAPVANLVILVGSVLAERFLYLPSIGFAGCVVWAAYRFVPRRALPYVFSVICLAMAARTWARNADWVDERTLWASAAEAAPASYKTHENRATLFLAQTPPDVAAATREVERALAVLDSLPDERNLPNVYATAGQCYRAAGDLKKARTVLERGRRIDRAWNDAFQRRNREDGKTVSSVGTPPLYLELGRVFRDLGQPDDALNAFREGRAIDPQPAFFEEISHTYVGMGRPQEAAISLLEGVAANASPNQMASALVKLYQATAPESCALNRTAAGISVNVGCPLVHDQLCTASHNAAAMFTQMRDAASAAAVERNAVQNYACPASSVQ